MADLKLKPLLHMDWAMRKLLDKIKAGEAEYHFIEVMACPGGC